MDPAHDPLFEFFDLPTLPARGDTAEGRAAVERGGHRDDLMHIQIGWEMGIMATRARPIQCIFDEYAPEAMRHYIDWYVQHRVIVPDIPGQFAGDMAIILACRPIVTIIIAGAVIVGVIEIIQVPFRVCLYDASLSIWPTVSILFVEA
jgi:hypothetical protein